MNLSFFDGFRFATGQMVAGIIPVLIFGGILGGLYAFGKLTGRIK